MTYMTGPGGKGHCTRMSCMAGAVVEHRVEITHPGRPVYFKTYPFCGEHIPSDENRKRYYPNFRVVEKRNV